MGDCITIKGAREHNLKNIDLAIPRNKLVVVTGVSGSGKSSLAFDTLYAEGQRRYVESLSAYARQFLEQLQKPNVEFIDGLSPSIAIEQRTAGGNPRSTVGTQTEIYDYLRLLFARIGDQHCFRCGRAIQGQSAQEIIEAILAHYENREIFILAPIVKGKKGVHKDILKEMFKEGFARVRVDKKIEPLPYTRELDKKKAHTIELVIDELAVKQGKVKRLADSVELGLKIGKGVLIVLQTLRSHEKETLFSESYACAHCGISYYNLEPRSFSFNSPYGACPACNGLGTKLEIDYDLVIPDKNKSIAQGAIEAWRRGGKGYLMYYRWFLKELSRHMGFSLDTPFKELPSAVKDAILYGTEEVIGGYKKFEGLIPHLERLFRETDSEHFKIEISRFMSELPCPQCKGKRLKPEALAVTIRAQSIADVCALSVKDARAFFKNLTLNEKKKKIAAMVLKEVDMRLSFLEEVGLDYLTLDRQSATLSGGEAQRIQLATQIGSSLVGVLYILDEPSVGLHVRDHRRLIATLQKLRDLGNTVIVVEHDAFTIQSADFIVDLGPGAGKHGGHVVAAGPVKDIIACKSSLTGQYLKGTRQIPIPAQRRKPKEKYLTIKGAREHNLKNITVSIPLGLFVCITGVSGSGKSTLVDDILYRALAKKMYGAKLKPGRHTAVTGIDNVDKVIVVDQSPIGRTPRSNPATYIGVFSFIREFFAQLPEARMRGYKPGRFSFNVKGGRCEACEGEGMIKVEMHFLPDIYVQCEVCKGMRFNEQTLQVKYKGYSIADILRATVDDCSVIFENIPKIRHKLQTIKDVGLGYIELGQPATTLSGGEAQRVKLAAELSKKDTGRTLYILDEPTTGLHFADIEKLLEVLQRLVSQGNTVRVIEHNIDVIKQADHIIDLGPEGGAEGGFVVAQGSPETLTRVARSHTGFFLKEAL